MFDRNKTIIHKKHYIDELKKYIEENNSFPAINCEPITLAFDKKTQKAILWEGNHRISAIASMKKGTFPVYVKVKFVEMPLTDYKVYDDKPCPALPKMPTVLPTYRCGCDFGLECKDN